MKSLMEGLRLTVHPPIFNLAGKCAVVIGGTAGIGRAIAVGLAGAGADVVATSRTAASVDAVAAEIEALGRRSTVVGGAA
jgi:NAD(P)-dependent dehydrogenase (short-subunit alcohol dehydrogenase family)